MSGAPAPAIVPHGERPRDRMPCLDGLRGLAAVMVVLGHAGEYGLPSFLDGGASHCGVLIFFALSGFLMGDLYLLRTPTRARLEEYGAARIARILPIYYLVVLVAFAIHTIDPAFAYAVTPVQLLRLLTFNGSVSVFWSIGPEVQFYAVFAALWVLHGRLRNDAVFAGLVLALTGFALLTIHRWPGVFVASKVHIFALGMLAALLRPRLIGRLAPPMLAIVHVVAFAVLILFMASGLAEAVLGPTPFDRGIDPAFTIFYGSLSRALLAAFLALAFSFETRPAAALLGNSLAAHLGRCSFSIYLLHVPIYDTATRIGLLARLPRPAATLTVLLVTIGVSTLTYMTIEVPSRRAVRMGLLRLLQGRTRLSVSRHRPA